MSTIQIYDGEKFVPFNISNAIEMPVGFEDYVSYTELDPGQLIRNGQLVSREIYSDLWNFVQSKPSMLLTEEEWQANLTANEGLACNYYSAGDGSTNFRLPKASVIVLPDPNPENINKYSTDTQRNITGLLAPRTITNQDRNLFINASSTWDTGYQSLNDMGAFRIKDISWSGSHLPIQTASEDLSNYKTSVIDFDASRSVGADHTAEEVKPKSITKLPIVYAFGRIVNTGTLDITDIANQLLNMVTIDTTQTITGVKSFNKTVNFNYYTNFNYAFTVDVAAKFNNQVRIKDGQSLVWLDTNDVTLASINKSNYTGNSDTATKLQTARTINGISFDGSADITVPEQVQYGTEDLTAGTSSLATGRIYCVYE